MFLDYGGDKEFDVKGYVDASFNTYPNDSEQQNRIRIVEQPFGIAPSGAWKQHLQYDLEICEVHTVLNIADLLTKTSLTSKT